MVHYTQLLKKVIIYITPAEWPKSQDNTQTSFTGLKGFIKLEWQQLIQSNINKAGLGTATFVSIKTCFANYDDNLKGNSIRC